VFTWGDGLGGHGWPLSYGEAKKDKIVNIMEEIRVKTVETSGQVPYFYFVALQDKYNTYTQIAMLAHVILQP